MIIFTTLILNSKEGQVIGSLIHLAILIPFLFLRSKLSAFFKNPETCIILFWKKVRNLVHGIKQLGTTPKFGMQRYTRNVSLSCPISRIREKIWFIWNQSPWQYINSEIKLDLWQNT